MASDETLIQVTEDDVEIGPVSRRLCHSDPSLIHRSVHVMVLNDNGNLLLQKRSINKDIQPGKWDTSVGGHVCWGQSYLEAGLREAREELGVSLSDMVFLYKSTIRNYIESENIATFFSFCNGPFTHQAEEIDELRYWSKTEIETNLGKEIFTPNFEEEFRHFLQCPQSGLFR